MPQSYADTPTERLRNILAGREVIAEGLAATIAEMRERLRKAEGDLQRIGDDQAHLEALIRWREESHSDAGDPITPTSPEE